MKRINLPDAKFTSLTVNEAGEREIVAIAPIEMLRMISYHCGERGMTIPEQRQRVPLWEKLEGTKNGVVVLEDAEWETLKPLVDAFPWGQTGKHIVEFGDAIMEAETVSIEEVGANRETRRRVGRKER